MRLPRVPPWYELGQRRRGYLEQLPSGSTALVFAGKDPLTGRLRYIRAPCKTVDEAGAALTQRLRQLDQQQHPTVRDQRS